MTVKSQKSVKGEYIHKHYAYVCTFMTFWSHGMFLNHSWLTAVTVCFEQSNIFESESLVRGHENVARTIYITGFCDFTFTTIRRKSLTFATSVDSESLRKFGGEDVLQ